jgi:hypothetical protein
MTYQIAFDIGTHHFAWSVLQVKDNTWNVISISCHDFLKNENANTYSFDQNFWKMFHDYVTELHLEIQKCDVCLIEKQMGFGSKINYKAIQMASQLMAHLVLYFPEKKIIEYPSTRKTKVFKQNINTWNKRKEWSVDFVLEKLKEQNDEIMIEWIKQYKKKDDICDTILMILAYNIEKKKFFSDRK